MLFTFNYDAGASAIEVWLVWILVFAALFGFNEVTRRFKWVGFAAFVALPLVLSVLWFTVLSETTYTDWFHLAKVYSATAGCIGFWCIRYLQGTRKDGTTWRLADNRLALSFPPFILALNICEAVARDIQVGLQYVGGGTADGMWVVGGPWNYMNAAAGVLNIITITGWMGIVVRRKVKGDGSRDMLWPDMLWFWIIAYDLWNFAYTYNCLPGHAWYCGFALLLAPTLCSFTLGKGAWLQHRAHTLALWCMFAQTVPAFIDEGAFHVSSTYSTTSLTLVSAAALLCNVLVAAYMALKVVRTRKNPYTGELYGDLAAQREVKALGEPSNVVDADGRLVRHGLVA
ncbi:MULTISPECIES: DUF5692 family protein [Actinomyces]|uniref:Uncharacterized protein n=1 Tax=Actinomyces respiraculi TaxID=2744574 RepID=A0A7T0LKX0_9ACTO|nr:MULTISPECIES: DUF5692 family protein [Actinomyces]QPL05502.1 hypothetical protein ID810_00405 [Actinomyces respiraculi]